MDGKVGDMEGTEVLISRLKVYQDRLLHTDWRNRSIFLRRIDKKFVLDLGRLWNGDVKKADDCLRKALRTHSEIQLVKDSDRSEWADQVRANCSALDRTARTIEEEMGLSDLYLGFPFLAGRPCPEGYVRAPLLLFPVRLERVRSEGIPGWYLTFQDEEPILNRALLAALRRLCGISLPDDLQERALDLIETSPKDGLPDYLVERFQALLSPYLKLEPAIPMDKVPLLNDLTTSDLDGFDKVELALVPFAAVGIFPQGSTAIYQDYERLLERVQKGETDLGFLDDLLEVHHLRATPPSIPNVDIDSTPDRELNNILPSDSSQDQVLLEAQRAEAVVVRGPPGTGKSQVITNLIANALAKDQKVLVVCQKRAALDVVHQRLGRVGLSDVAVVLHDSRADRAKMYAMLSQRLNGDPPLRDEGLERRFAQVSSEIDYVVQELNALVKPLWKEMPNGVRPRELYLRAAPSYVPRMNLGSLPYRLTASELDSLIAKLPELQLGFWRFDRAPYPWQARIPFSQFELKERFEIDAALLRAISFCLQETLVIGDPQKQSEALSLMNDYFSLEGKFLHQIRPRWRSSLKLLSSLRNQFPSDPRVNDAQRTRDALSLGLELMQSVQDLGRWLSPRGLKELLDMASQPGILRERLEAMRSALKDFDAMKEHDRRVASLSPKEREAYDLCSAQLPADGEPWKLVLEQEMLLSWISEFERTHPLLSGDPLSRYRGLSARLAELLEERRELLRRWLAWKALDSCRRRRLPPGEHHPNKRPETEWNRLLDELNKKRRVKSVRQLMELYPFQLMTAAPVWLVSPEVVSEVFPLQKGLFDLVIFDESSQLAVERALPSIYRGKRVVIAGDEKQLRPFDLFRSQDEEELDEVTEAESLLMLAMRNVSPRYLSWHYRSKFQELIDFSNYAFYEGNLQIAANVQRLFERAPIEFVKVEGRWEDRRNKVEAEKVVDLIYNLLSEGERKGRIPSIGVITFNERQRDLIEDVIESRRITDKEFDRLFALSSSPSRNLDDRPFVKNIENVQGDERDVVIFSVAYAKDSSGKLRVQFGPLNLEGGENRLNVAITRARVKVIMVASFDPAELPVEEVKNLGPKRLKDYLLYAQAVSRMDREEMKDVLKRVGTFKSEGAPEERAPLSLESMIKTALEAQGLLVEERVGFSGYKVDLAVVHPKDPSRYILGIEGDGWSFQSAKSARERDVVRPKYLIERGWNLERVWSRYWWRDREGEVHRLIRRIDALCKEVEFTAKRPLEP
ncbi:MAG: AAA domain-containing protein [Methanomassiliicoccales archaeon]